MLTRIDTLVTFYGLSLLCNIVVDLVIWSFISKHHAHEKAVLQSSSGGNLVVDQPEGEYNFRCVAVLKTGSAWMYWAFTLTLLIMRAVDISPDMTGSELTDLILGILSAATYPLILVCYQFDSHGEVYSFPFVHIFGCHTHIEAPHAPSDFDFAQESLRIVGKRWFLRLGTIVTQVLHYTFVIGFFIWSISIRQERTPIEP